LIESKPNENWKGNMAIQLNVPLVAQMREMDCWYAGACMVAYYYEAGPRLGLPARWAENKGILPDTNDFPALAKTEGLVSVVAPNRVWTESNLTKLLQDFGPIWCVGGWYGFGHVVVLTGVDETNVHINDPDGGVAKVQSIAWFNQKLWKDVSGCMMRRDK
jgi:hypothetical protein